MKNISVVIILFLVGGCKTNETTNSKKFETIYSFQGQQVTGVTVSSQKRLFANFPRWRENVDNSVVEIVRDQALPYPSAHWNEWELGDPVHDSVFVAVQSVVASGDSLFVIDTRNPLFQGVVGTPILFVFDLKTNELACSYPFPENAFHRDSYINDLRVDHLRKTVYFTDSGHPGLVILDLKDGSAKRVLDNHPSTTSEKDFLTIDSKKWNNAVHADGIAFDRVNGMLYYHALTGYSLYRIPVEVLINGSNTEIEESVEFVFETPAPDGMILNKSGELYFGDLENHRIVKFDTKSGQLFTVVESEEHIKWADTFSIYEDELYYTNSAIHLAQGDVSKMEFEIKMIKLD